MSSENSSQFSDQPLLWLTKLFPVVITYFCQIFFPIGYLLPDFVKNVKRGAEKKSHCSSPGNQMFYSSSSKLSWDAESTVHILYLVRCETWMGNSAEFSSENCYDKHCGFLKAFPRHMNATLHEKRIAIEANIGNLPLENIALRNYFKTCLETFGHNYCICVLTKKCQLTRIRPSSVIF